MSYKREKERIIDYITQDGEIIQLLPNEENKKKYYIELSRYNAYRKLAIRYPGYKTTRYKSDYCVILVDRGEENEISHNDIMCDLYDKTTVANYYNIRRYVEDVATIGLDINESDYKNIDFNKGFSFDELTELMFYIALQEDINYPGERYEGRKMCFYRYIEAIYCKVNTNHTIHEAYNRANNRNYRPTKWSDVGDLYDNISRIER